MHNAGAFDRLTSLVQAKGVLPLCCAVRAAMNAADNITNPQGKLSQISNACATTELRRESFTPAVLKSSRASLRAAKHSGDFDGKISVRTS